MMSSNQDDDGESGEQAENQVEGQAGDQHGNCGARTEDALLPGRVFQGHVA